MLPVLVCRAFRCARVIFASRQSEINRLVRALSRRSRRIDRGALNRGIGIITLALSSENELYRLIFDMGNDLLRTEVLRFY